MSAVAVKMKELRAKLKGTNQSGFGGKRQRGIATTDAILWLGVIAVVGSVIISKGDWAYDSYRVWKFKGQVADISSGVNEWGSGKHNLTGLDMNAISTNVPGSIGDGQGTNAFGGNFTVAPGTSAYSYVVKGTKVPAKAGNRVKSGYSDATYDTNTQTVTITLGD